MFLKIFFFVFLRLLTVGAFVSSPLSFHYFYEFRVVLFNIVKSEKLDLNIALSHMLSKGACDTEQTDGKLYRFTQGLIESNKIVLVIFRIGQGFEVWGNIRFFWQPYSKQIL